MKKESYIPQKNRLDFSSCPRNSEIEPQFSERWSGGPEVLENKGNRCQHHKTYREKHNLLKYAQKPPILQKVIEKNCSFHENKVGSCSHWIDEMKDPYYWEITVKSMQPKRV